MYDLVVRSGAEGAEWLMIAHELKLTNQMLVGVFLEAWKDSDATGRSWLKLATALKSISEGDDLYEHASEQAEKNAGMLMKNFVNFVKRPQLQHSTCQRCRKDFLMGGHSLKPHIE